MFVFDFIKSNGYSADVGLWLVQVLSPAHSVYTTWLATLIYLQPLVQSQPIDYTKDQSPLTMVQGHLKRLSETCILDFHGKSFLNMSILLINYQKWVKNWLHPFLGALWMPEWKIHILQLKTYKSSLYITQLLFR